MRGAFGGSLALAAVLLVCIPADSNDLFNDWGGRGYDDSIPGEVTKTASSGDRTT